MPLWLLRLARVLGPLTVRWLVANRHRVLADPRVVATFWQLSAVGGRLTRAQRLRYRLAVLRERIAARLEPAGTPEAERAGRLLTRVEQLLETLDYARHMAPGNRDRALDRLEADLDALMVAYAEEALTPGPDRSVAEPSALPAPAAPPSGSAAPPPSPVVPPLSVLRDRRDT